MLDCLERFATGAGNFFWCVGGVEALHVGTYKGMASDYLVHGAEGAAGELSCFWFGQKGWVRFAVGWLHEGSLVC